MTKKVIMAIMNDDLRSFLSSLPPDINGQDPQGRTLLMHCALHSRESMVAKLLDLGANPTLSETQGWTALHFAAQSHCESIGKLLLQHGADVNAQDVYGNTPLGRVLFSCKGRDSFVNILLAYGADPDLKNGSGVSPRMLAEKVSNYNLKDLFPQKDIFPTRG